MAWAYDSRAAGALLALLLTSPGCSLSADLESLTSGNGKTDDRSTDGGSQMDGGGECSRDSCSNGKPPSMSTPEVGASNAGSTTTGSIGGSSDSEPSNAEPSSAGPNNSEASTGGADTSTLSEPQSSPSTEGFAPSDGGSDPSGPTSSSTASSTTSSTGAATSEETCAGGSECSAPGLVHRYSFAQAEASIEDSVGNANGTVVGNAVFAAGSFVFDGSSYVELPPEVLAARENVTIEAWFTSYNTRNWERIFDAGEADDGSGDTYLFLTSQTPSANGTMRVTFRADGETEVVVNSEQPTADDLATHVAVVFDGSENQLRLYHNGELSASGTTQGSLQDVNVSSVWLGRSLFDSDPLFEGELSEFRIYDETLSDSRIRANYEAGPDTLAQ